MEKDKFVVIAHLILCISDRMGALCSSYLSEELDDLLSDLKKPEWQVNCRMERFDTGYRLIDPLLKGTCAEIFDDGDIYIGTFNKAYKRDGFGAYFYQNGNVYYGPWENDERSGQGYKEYANGKHERVYAEAPVANESFIYNRSDSFWQRLVLDKMIGRLDFLLGNILLTLLVVILVRFVSAIYATFVFAPIFILWLILYIKRCRDCGFHFLVGLLFLVFSPLTLLVYIWPGKYVSAQSVSSSSGNSSASAPGLKISALASGLGAQLKQQANTSTPPTKEPDRPFNTNKGRAGTEREPLNLPERDDDPQGKRKQQEQDDANAQRKQLEENERQRAISEQKSTYDNARRNYEYAMSKAESAFTQAQTEKSYAEDEERKARDYDDESAMSRAREYIERYNMYMDESSRAKQEAEGYKYEMELCRNRLALLKEYI